MLLDILCNYAENMKIKFRTDAPLFSHRRGGGVCRVNGKESERYTKLSCTLHRKGAEGAGSN